MVGREGQSHLVRLAEPDLRGCSKTGIVGGGGFLSVGLIHEMGQRGGQNDPKMVSSRHKHVVCRFLGEGTDGAKERRRQIVQGKRATRKRQLSQRWRSRQSG